MPRKIEEIDERIPEPSPTPTWERFFPESLEPALVSKFRLESEAKIAYLRSALPIAAERYVGVRRNEAKPGLADRRRDLLRVCRDARKLRLRLLDLKGLASIDFMTVAARYTGSGTTVNAPNPFDWLARTGETIRDVGVVAGAASQDLRTKSVKGGRPRHAALRLLMSDLGFIYHRITGRRPGRRGHFTWFVNEVISSVDPRIANIDHERLIHEAVAEFSKA
jgi:hypothetical protein